MATKQEQSKRPSFGTQTHNMWSVHTVSYYSAIKREQNADIGYHVDKPKKHTEWKKPDARSQIEWFDFYEMCRKDNFVETEDCSVVAWGWEGEWGLTANRFEVILGSDGMFQNRIVIVTAQLYKFSENHWIVHSQWVNLMVYKFCPNKAVNKNTLSMLPGTQGELNRHLLLFIILGMKF